MTFKIEGLRKNGNGILITTNDKRVAMFEYDVTKCVSQYIALYKREGEEYELIECSYN